MRWRGKILADKARYDALKRGMLCRRLSFQFPMHAVRKLNHQFTHVAHLLEHYNKYLNICQIDPSLHARRNPSARAPDILEPEGLQLLLENGDRIGLHKFLTRQSSTSS